MCVCVQIFGFGRHVSFGQRGLSAETVGYRSPYEDKATMCVTLSIYQPSPSFFFKVMHSFTSSLVSMCLCVCLRRDSQPPYRVLEKKKTGC